jgi:UDP-N-acetylmuramate dehydrogenase
MAKQITNPQSQNIKNLLPGIKKNVPLKNHTTFKIGGKAKYFFIAKTKRNIIKAISVAKKLGLPFFVLGGGSNLLVSDLGYKGLVIKIQDTKYEILNTKIYAGAGVLLSKPVAESINRGLAGLEWAVGIPGTVGGAIYGNAGAFGKSIGDSIEEVEIFDTKDLEIKTFKNKDCKFGYRDSIFKNKKNLIILSAVLQLKKGNEKVIQEKMKKYLEHRRESQPLNYPSAGSIFKNPKGFFAAELVEKCGLKGKRIGNVKISEKHANFIVNLGQGRAKDVKKLINLVKKEVKEIFGVVLEEEIQYLK